MKQHFHPMPACIETNGPYSRRYYGGGGDAPAQTATTNVNQLYSPEEAARRAKVMAEAENIYTQTSGNIQNLAPAGPSAQTLQAQNMMQNYASGQGTDTANQLAAAQKFGLSDVLYPGSNPALQATIDTATRKVGEAYTDPGGVFSNIRSGFTAGSSGGTGSREGIAMGLAGRSYLDTVGDVTGKISSDAYTKGLDVMGRTMALAPQNAQMAMQPAAITGAIGQQNEAYAEQQRQFEQNSPWSAMGPYANIVMGMSNPSTQTTATTPGAQSNPMAPLGMAMQGAALGTMIAPGWGTAIGAGAGLLLSMFS